MTTLKELQQASYLNYGVVSLHASDALRMALEGKPLSVRNRDSLSGARAFLESVASGVDLVVSGESHGQTFDAMDSVGALGIAMDPLASMQRTLASPGAASLIRSLADALQSCLDGVSSLSLECKAKLQAAHSLFDAIYDRISRDLGQHPIFGGPDEDRIEWQK